MFLFFFSILLTLPLLPFYFLPFSLLEEIMPFAERIPLGALSGSLTGKSTLQENSLLGNALRCRRSRKDEIWPKKDKQSGWLEQHGRRKREGHCGWVGAWGHLVKVSCRVTCAMHCSALGHTGVS